MGRFVNFVLGTSIVTIASATFISKKYIYVGDYLERNPFDETKLKAWDRIKYKIIGSNDDIKLSKTNKLINPNKNPVVYDYFEKKLDADTTKKILSKYKTNDEIITQLQKGVFLGPSLWVHRFYLSSYFQKKTPFNRIAGFTPLEPELKKVDVNKLPRTGKFDYPLLPKNDKLKYIWNGDDVKSFKTPFPKNTIVYGLFDFVDYGVRSNGGYFEFTFGSDLLRNTAIHRIDYFVEKNASNEKKLVVRFTNASALVAPKSPYPIDDFPNLHEFMTRTIVLDAIRGLTKEL